MKVAHKANKSTEYRKFRIVNVVIQRLLLLFCALLICPTRTIEVQLRSHEYGVVRFFCLLETMMLVFGRDGLTFVPLPYRDLIR